jgi:hypothetical protein
MQWRFPCCWAIDLKAVRESQTFWIPSDPPVKDTLATLLNSYGLSLREHLSWGHETNRKHLPGGLAVGVVLSAQRSALGFA